MRYRIWSLLLTVSLTIGILVFLGATAALADEFLRLPFFVFFPSISLFLCLLSLRQLWIVRDERTMEWQRRIPRAADRSRINSLWNDILAHLALLLRTISSWWKRTRRSTPITVEQDFPEGADLQAKAVEATTSAYRRLEALRARASCNHRFVLRSVIFRPATSIQDRQAGR
jgi:hypothetical protein